MILSTGAASGPASSSGSSYGSSSFSSTVFLFHRSSFICSWVFLFSLLLFFMVLLRFGLLFLVLLLFRLLFFLLRSLCRIVGAMKSLATRGAKSWLGSGV